MNISTNRKRGCRTLERRRERERKKMMMTAIYYVKKCTRIARRHKIGIEPIWFEIMPRASFYSVLRNTPEVSRMFQRNLEYTSIFYSKT